MSGYNLSIVNRSNPLKPHERITCNDTEEAVRRLMKDQRPRTITDIQNALRKDRASIKFALRNLRKMGLVQSEPVKPGWELLAWVCIE